MTFPTPTLYGRRYRLIAGPQVRGEVSTGFEWTEHQLEIDITKTARRGSNKATLKLYNISDAELGVLEQDNVGIILEAGYTNTSSLIFQGSVIRRGVKTTWNGTDRVTEIKAAEGQAQISTTRVRLSLAPGSTSRQVLNLIADQMFLAPGNVNTIPSITYNGGYSFVGPARAVLDEIARDLGGSWVVQDGALYILSDDLLVDDTAILLSPESGLIGEASKVKEGVEAESLLQARLVPGKLVQIDDREVQGLYKIREVQHAGSYRGGSWTSKVKAKKA